MKRRRTLSLLLCLCLALTLLPTTALAADAVVQYLVINGTESAPTCTYQSPNTADGANGVLITGGDTAYTLDSNWNGYIIVNNASVTYNAAVDLSRFGSRIYVFGTSSFAASNVAVTKGSYDTAYSGSNGTELLTFIKGLRDGDTDYSYTLKTNTTLDNFLTAYALTIPTGKTLTVSAPAEGSEGLPTYNRLTVTNALTVNGTLTAAAGQLLLIGENAAVTGLALYDTNGTDTYTFAATHNTEEFSFTNTGTEQTPDWRWVLWKKDML